ncbi:adenylate kinase isoenzyme 6 [Cimex lectularius]|uniref:Adenylate kinase isoenzyme 6 homolog n=1 Tax=Cimex lectularius TaxID=79782 RepID=A0A8I6S408_CIMLE|nr:adenylate kinase isoenzyme 6 [Cimex lectularius]
MGRCNILITGTPCSGKSTIAKDVAEKTGFTWINISDIAIQENLIESYDEAYSCPIIDEEKVINFLSQKIEKGNNLIEYHGCSFFPDDWFSAVFVPRTETSYLYDRLINRGYSGRKLNDNMECEIFQVLLEEARETFDPSIVHELQNNTLRDLEKNVSTIVSEINKLKYP